jgi:drug/metabolite transporter (DMT)-like permease
MLVSLVAGLVAAVAYGVASVMQAVATRAASEREQGQTGVDPGLIGRLLRQGPFIASLLLDLAGFGAQLVALHRLPLFAVQAMVAANLAVIAVLDAIVFRATPSGRERLAVLGVVAGVALLGSSAGAEGATHVSTAFKVGVIVAAGIAGALGLAAAKLRGQRARSLALGTVAGVGYGLVGIAARVLTGFRHLSLFVDPALYGLVAAAAVAFVFYTTALEGGSVTVVTGAVVLAETVPPAVIGVLFLGDSTRHGLAPVAAAGFVLAVASALMLAHYGEGEGRRERRPKHAGGTGSSAGKAAGKAASGGQRVPGRHRHGDEQTRK